MIKINKENVKKREQQLIHFKGFVPIDFLNKLACMKKYRKIHIILELLIVNMVCHIKKKY